MSILSRQPGKSTDIPYLYTLPTYHIKTSPPLPNILSMAGVSMNLTSPDDTHRANSFDVFLCGGCSKDHKIQPCDGIFLNSNDGTTLQITQDLINQVKTELAQQKREKEEQALANRQSDDLGGHKSNNPAPEEIHPLIKRGMVQMENSPSPRYNHHLFVYGDSIWMLCGWDGHHAYPELYAFDPVSLTWFAHPETIAPEVSPIPPHQFPCVVQFGRHGQYILIYGSWGVNQSSQITLLSLQGLGLPTFVKPKVAGDIPPSTYGVCGCAVAVDESVFDVYLLFGQHWRPEEMIVIPGGMREKELERKKGEEEEKQKKKGNKKKGAVEEPTISPEDLVEFEARGKGTCWILRVEEKNFEGSGSVTWSPLAPPKRPVLPSATKTAVAKKGNQKQVEEEEEDEDTKKLKAQTAPKREKLVFPDLRIFGQCCSVGENIFVMGGERVSGDGVVDGVHLGDVWSLNIKTRMWRPHTFITPPSNASTPPPSLRSSIVSTSSKHTQNEPDSRHSNGPEPEQDKNDEGRPDEQEEGEHQEPETQSDPSDDFTTQPFQELSASFPTQPHKRYEPYRRDWHTEQLQIPEHALMSKYRANPTPSKPSSTAVSRAGTQRLSLPQEDPFILSEIERVKLSSSRITPFIRNPKTDVPTFVPRAHFVLAPLTPPTIPPSSLTASQAQANLASLPPSERNEERNKIMQGYPRVPFFVYGGESDQDPLGDFLVIDLPLE
ncbi:hypothetical protein BLNAU_12664 [Blattamonas nauphoetae]|uniref:Uncharacterized protein n=1 Tax=Blattamonas nauphoetae TaxID=2049346 RepID=A0ABQ9XIZ7_9EUKA|nr:hypothetical protein BLNAU_12664 [Blattamonas nauphoetae]